SRVRAIEESVTTATRSRRPPQGQCRTSVAKTRRRRSAQRKRAAGDKVDGAGPALVAAAGSRGPGPHAAGGSSGPVAGRSAPEPGAAPVAGDQPRVVFEYAWLVVVDKPVGLLA